MRYLLLTSALFALSPAAAQPVPATAGEKLWVQCRACHSIERGAANKIGPNLNGIVGQAAAKRPGFAYSEALKASQLVWDRATLDRWIAKPNAVLKGHRMVFIGVADAGKRAALIDYLEQSSR